MSSKMVFLTPLTKTSEEHCAVTLRLSGAILREGQRDELNRLVGETLVQDICGSQVDAMELNVDVRAFKVENPMLEHSFFREGSFSAAIGRGVTSRLGSLPLPEAIADAFVDTNSLYG